MALRCALSTGWSTSIARLNRRRAVTAFRRWDAGLLIKQRSPRETSKAVEAIMSSSSSRIAHGEGGGEISTPPDEFCEESQHELLGDTVGIGRVIRQQTLKEGRSNFLVQDEGEFLNESLAKQLPREKLVQLITASRVVCAEINPKRTIGFILTEARKLLNCGACVLYIYAGGPDTSKLIPIVSDPKANSTSFSSSSSVAGRQQQPVSAGMPFRLVKLREMLDVEAADDTASEACLSGAAIRRCTNCADQEPPTREEIERCQFLHALSLNLSRGMSSSTGSASASELESAGGSLSVLTVPVWDPSRKVRAVLKVINKLTESAADDDSEKTIATVPSPFSDQDAEVLRHFSLLAGVALRNAALYKEAVSSRDTADGLLTLLSSLRPDLGVQSALFTLSAHAKKIMQVEHCTTYMIDRLTSHLISVSSDSPDVSPMLQLFNEDDDQTLLGECARQGVPLIREGGERDLRGGRLSDFSIAVTEGEEPAGASISASRGGDIAVSVEGRPSELSQPSAQASFSTTSYNVNSTSGSSTTPRQVGGAGAVGFPVQATSGNEAVVPIIGENEIVVGLIKLNNKQDEEGSLLSFTEEDIRILELFGRLVGPRLERSDLGVKATSVPSTEAGKAENIIPPCLQERRRPSLAAPSIREELEEGESASNSSHESREVVGDGERDAAHQTHLARPKTLAPSGSLPSTPPPGSATLGVPSRKPSILTQRLTHEALGIRSMSQSVVGPPARTWSAGQRGGVLRSFSASPAQNTRPARQNAPSAQDPQTRPA